MRLIILILTILFLTGCYTNKYNKSKLYNIAIDGDISSRRSSNQSHPDTCIAYYDLNDKHLHIKYIRRDLR